MGVAPFKRIPVVIFKLISRVALRRVRHISTKPWMKAKKFRAPQSLSHRLRIVVIVRDSLLQALNRMQASDLMLLIANARDPLLAARRTTMADPLHIAGHFAETRDANEAFEALTAAGFKQSDLNLLAPSSKGEEILEKELSETEPPVKGPMGVWNGIVGFLQAETHFDPFSKENIGSEAVHAAGQPCHGGYAYEREQAARKERTGATVLVDTNDRDLEARAILKAHNGSCTG